jgi:hypothetical protein
MASITTAFNENDWVYGFSDGEVYAGSVESISVSVDGVTTIEYKISGRTTLVAEGDLEADKAALDAAMIVAEDAQSESSKSAYSTQITALPTS